MENYYLPENNYKCELCGYYVPRCEPKINIIKNSRVRKIRACKSCQKNKLDKYFSYYIEK